MSGLWGKMGWFRSGKIRTHVGELIALPLETDPQAATTLLEERVKGLDGGGFSS